MSIINVKFDVYFKRELGTLFKSNEVDLDGLEANVNLDLNLVESMKINYLIDGKKLTDDIVVKDKEKRLILIPFKSEVRVGGRRNKFEIQANMKNGDVKVSQTYGYDVEMGIGEGAQVGTGGSGDGHTHSNLSTLDKVTESKLKEWDDKSNFSGSYNDLTDKPTDLATQTYVNQKIAEASLSGGEVDLSAYATIEFVEQEIEKIELTPGPQGPQGEKGDIGPQGLQGEKGEPGTTSWNDLEDKPNLNDYVLVENFNQEIDKTNAQLSAVKEHCTGGNGMQDHSHVNKNTIDKLSESSDGKLMFNNKILGAELENGLSAGSYADARKKALDNNTPFQFLLRTEDFTKPIFHLGNCVFVDAVGAEVEDELDEKLIYNFTYKVKLTVDNEIVYVPVDNAYEYNMYVDWGDGSEDTYFTGAGTLKSCSHQYSGTQGEIFTIIVYGQQIPKLDFGTLSRGGQQTLFAVENNTLKNEILLTFSRCPNLEKIAQNTFRNYTGTSIDFADCTSLTLIEDGFSTYINKSNITSVSFKGTKISKIDDDLFDGINLTSADSLFRGTSLTKVPTSLPGALANCSDFYYAFFGILTSLKIPDELFDNVKVAINDVRNCFNGGSTASVAPLTGDAKRLYDALSSKITGTNYAGCFANNTLSNRDQVPTSWGGTLK